MKLFNRIPEDAWTTTGMNLRKLLRGFGLALHYMVGKKRSRYRQIILDILRVFAMMEPALSFTMNQVQIKVGLIGLGHNHASAKMATLRKQSDHYEAVGIIKSESIPQGMESV